MVRLKFGKKEFVQVGRVRVTPPKGLKISGDISSYGALRNTHYCHPTPPQPQSLLLVQQSLVPALAVDQIMYSGFGSTYMYMQIPLLQEIKTANDAQIPHRQDSFLSWCKEMGMLNTSHNAIIA